MTACPDPSVLEAFVQGTLDPTTRTGLEQHLDGCRDCAETTAELARLFGSASWAASVPASLAETHHSAAPPGVAASAGPAVGRYQLGARLGAGGMGVVFEAHDPELHRRVAIKLLHPGASADADKTRTRLLREARAMARLAHPNVVAVHDVGRAGDQVFVAMELVQGLTLRQWLRQKSWTQREILDVFAQAGRGLQAAHEVGLVHRDFKPDNVLIGADGRARVTDFGLAQPALSWNETDPHPNVPPGEDPLLMSTAITTAHGAIEGTPAYMAPEQWRGETADARSDQFSFCVALYEALFSTRPFPGDHWTALCQSVLSGALTPPGRSAPGWLRAALVRGLALQPDRRHASMESLLAPLAKDRRSALRVGSIAGAMAVGAAATVGVLAWVTNETSATEVAEEAEEAEDAAAPASDTATPEPEGAGSTTGAPRVDATPPDLGPPAVASTEDEACIADAIAVAGHWTPDRRKLLADRIATMDPADAIATRTVPLLDAWAKSYGERATALCGSDNGPASDVRRRCLDDAAGHLDALAVRSVELETFRVQKSLTNAAYGLPVVERCDADAWLAAWPKAPPADVAAKAHLLASDLQSVVADLGLRQLTRSPADAERIEQEAATLGYGPLHADAQLTLGQLAAQRLMHDIAVTWLEQAAVTAETAKHGIAQAHAALALIEQQGARQLQPGSAKRWRRIARSFADRTQDARFSAATTLAEGQLEHAVWELQSAKTTLTKAVEEHRRAYGPGHPALANAHVALSGLLLDLGEADDAVEQAKKAAAMLLEGLGKDDLRYGVAQTALARALLLRGDTEDARTAATVASKVPFTSSSLRHDYDRGDAMLVLGDAQAAAGETEAAIKTYDKARIYHYTGPRKVEPSLRLGALLMETGNTAAGLRELEAALVEAQLHYSADDPRLVAPLRALGRAQTRAKKYKTARLTLQRALDIADAKLGYGPFQARCLFDLAELEQAAGKKKRALELFDDLHVPWVGAYGMRHPAVLAELLARADLAYALGQKEYAGRLYRTNAEPFAALFGEESGPAKRARARQTAE